MTMSEQDPSPSVAEPEKPRRGWAKPIAAVAGVALVGGATFAATTLMGGSGNPGSSPSVSASPTIGPSAGSSASPRATPGDSVNLGQVGPEIPGLYPNALPVTEDVLAETGPGWVAILSQPRDDSDKYLNDNGANPPATLFLASLDGDLYVVPPTSLPINDLKITGWEAGERGLYLEKPSSGSSTDIHTTFSLDLVTGEVTQTGTFPAPGSEGTVIHSGLAGSAELQAERDSDSPSDPPPWVYTLIAADGTIVTVNDFYGLDTLTNKSASGRYILGGDTFYEFLRASDGTSFTVNGFGESCSWIGFLPTDNRALVQCAPEGWQSGGEYVMPDARVLLIDPDKPDADPVIVWGPADAGRYVEVQRVGTGLLVGRGMDWISAFDLWWDGETLVDLNRVLDAPAEFEEAVGSVLGGALLVQFTNPQGEKPALGARLVWFNPSTGEEKVLLPFITPSDDYPNIEGDIRSVFAILWERSEGED